MVTSATKRRITTNTNFASILKIVNFKRTYIYKNDVYNRCVNTYYTTNLLCDYYVCLHLLLYIENIFFYNYVYKKIYIHTVKVSNALRL